MRILFVIAVWSIMVSCSKKTEIISPKNVKSILVTVNDNEASSVLIANSDSIRVILSKLNDSSQEPIKFYATHRLSVNYNDGKQALVLCSGSSMKIEGRTYKLKETIGDILNR